MASDATQGYVPVPDGQIYFERAGQGPALVLIHSAFLDRREWDPQFAAYADRHTVVRFDVRGAGRSSGNPSVTTAGEDLEAVLDHLGLAKAFVLGNSDGARVACEFAAGLPDRVRGLILVAGGPGDLDPTPEEETRFMDTFVDTEQPLMEFVKSGRRAEAIEKILDIWAPSVSPSERDRLRLITAENYDHFAEFLSRDQPPGRRPAYPVASFLTTAGIPILVIAGGHDNPASNMKVGRFAQSVPTARFHLLADGDHTPSLSARAEFDRVVLDFLARVDGGLPWPPPPT